MKDTQKMRQRGQRKVRSAAFTEFMGRGVAALNVAKGQASKDWVAFLIVPSVEWGLKQDVMGSEGGDRRR